MKMKFAFATVFMMMLAGTYTPATVNTGVVGQPGNLTIVKGQLVDFGNDGSWDLLSFGVWGTRKSGYQVTRVEITSLDGTEVFVKLTDFFNFKDNGLNWYVLSLGGYDVPEEFLTRIYVKKPNGGIVLMAAPADEGGGNDNDPDETVIVVKWP